MSKELKKKCSRCSEYKTIDNFYKVKGNYLGVGSYCKKCETERKREWRQNNYTTYKKSMNNWNLKNKEKIKASNERIEHRKKMNARFYIKKNKGVKI